jgi:ATP-dependent Clp protease protease subunit
MKIPSIFETTRTGVRVMDLYSRLLRDRIILLTGGIDDDQADLVVAQLLFLEAEGGNQDISLYINSSGGSVTAGLAIYDTMQYITCDVATAVIGQATSMGAVLLAAGARGKRIALPNARVMIHQPWQQMMGQAADVEIEARELVRLRNQIVDLLAEHTSQTRRKILRDADRDFWLTAEAAQKYGIVDRVVARRELDKG